MIITNCNRNTQTSPNLKRLHWLPVEYPCIFKTSTFVCKLLRVISKCPFIVVDMTQDIAEKINGSERFRFNSTHLYINPKHTLFTVLLLKLPQFGMIYLMTFILPQLLLVSEKKPFFSFPTLMHKIPCISMVWTSLCLWHN